MTRAPHRRARGLRPRAMLTLAAMLAATLLGGCVVVPGHHYHHGPYAYHYDHDQHWH